MATKQNDGLTMVMVVFIIWVFAGIGGFLYGSTQCVPPEKVLAQQVSKGPIEQRLDSLNVTCNQTEETEEVKKACAYLKATR